MGRLVRCKRLNLWPPRGAESAQCNADPAVIPEPTIGQVRELVRAGLIFSPERIGG
jgi:hypothetical protein